MKVVQEHDDVAAGRISAVLIGSVVVSTASVAIAFAFLAFLLAHLPAHAAGSAVRAPRQIAGVHQTLIARDRHGWQQREEQRRALQGYAIVDSQAGIARIPIERAMQLIVDEPERARAAP
jgi:hypothetical protein